MSDSESNSTESYIDEEQDKQCTEQFTKKELEINKFNNIINNKNISEIGKLILEIDKFNNITNKNIPETEKLINVAKKTTCKITKKKNPVNSDDDEQKPKKIAKKDVSISKNIPITTEGLSYDQFNISNNQNLMQCGYCAKYYHHDMITPNTEGICKHCHFWINYNEANRLEFDKNCLKFGYCIADYIIQCKDDHIIETCEKNKIGSCFLCDFKSGVKIYNIVNSDILQYDNVPIKKQNDEKKVEEEPVDINFKEEAICTWRIPKKIIV